VVFTDATAMNNNFLHSLLSQCNVTLNSVTITQESEHYHYRSYLETLMTYGTEAAATNLSKPYWYLDTGDMLLSEPSAENLTATAHREFINRWKRFSASREVQLFGRLHSDMYNVPLYLLPGVRF